MKLFQHFKWTVIGVIVLSILFSFYFIDPVHKEIIIKDHPVIASTGAIKHETISQYPGIHLHVETEEKEDYTISLSVPTLEVEKVNQTIQQWIESEKANFLDEIKENERKDFQTHLNVRLEIRQHRENIYGLTFYSYRFTGGSNGQENIQTFVIDLEKDILLELRDLYSYSEENIEKTLKKMIKQSLADHPTLKDHLLEDNVEEVIEKEDAFKWSIDQHSLFIYFDEYEITSEAAGSVELKFHLNEFESQLEAYKQKKQKEKEKKVVALTFDDGPSPDVTPRVLNILQEYKAKATFFMLGSQVEFYPAIAKQVASLGHEVASHSYHHPDLTKMDLNHIQEEFKRTSEEIKKATGQEPTLFRPPYGAYNDEVINYAKDHNYAIVLWSIDSLDWKHRNPSDIINLILKDLTDGAIILLHDIHQTTADSLPQLLSTLKEEGYEFVTVSELLSMQTKEGVGPHRGNDPW